MSLTIVAESTTVSDNFSKSILALSEKDTLTKALNALSAGELIVAPTETSYGLLAKADNNDALERLYQAKRRPTKLVTAVFLSSAKEITKWATLPETAKTLCESFLPGPLTLVLPANDLALNTLAEQVIQNNEIGIRISASDFIAQLLEECASPITATSANLSGEKTPVRLSEIAEQFKDSVALYIDAGELSNPPSTVVRCGDTHIEILREGAIPRAELQSALGKQIEVR